LITWSVPECEAATTQTAQSTAIPVLTLHFTVFIRAGVLVQVSVGPLVGATLAQTARRLHDDLNSPFTERRTTAMAFGNTVTIIGNVTRDPELRYLSSGTAVANFGVAYNRKFTRSGEQVEEVSFFDVTCWKDLADNVAESLSKGDRVVVFGELKQESWETKDGGKRSKVTINAEDVAPSLRWATAKPQKQSNSNGESAPPRGRAGVDAGPEEEPF
jgi:single-strand DNA-binding protein